MAEQAEKPSYGAMHLRVQRLRGPARLYPCAHCQGTAEQWAYDHTDPTPLTEERLIRGRRFTCVYSIDPDHYIPLCVTCHRTYDNTDTRCALRHPGEPCRPVYTAGRRRCRTFDALRQRRHRASITPLTRPTQEVKHDPHPRTN